MLTLAPDELREITGGYTRAADQLRVLRDRGFYRAAIIRGILVLERSHYDAVTRMQAGEVAGTRRPLRKSERQKAVTA
jgi:hypothetical protein